jgi:hypothetical protein
MLERIPRWALHLGAVALAMAVLLFHAIAGSPYDFCTYYTAGRAADTSDTAAAFDFDEINELHSEIHPGEGRVGTFLYSPIFLVPAKHLSRLDFGSAQTANQILTLVSLAALLFLLLERTESLWLRAFLCFVFVVSDPVTNQFIYQNWSAHLALFVGAALYFTREKRDLPAALFWALAIHLKAFIVLFLVPLVFVGRRRLAAATVIAGLLLVAVSLPLVGFDAYSTYLDAMREQSGGWVTYFFNQVSVQSTIARYEFPVSMWPSATVAPSLALLDWIFWLALPIFGWLVYRLRHDESRALAVTVPFLLLFVPKIWDHTQILFFALFLTGALVRRTKVIFLAYLLLSFAYFPLVQHLLTEALRGEGSAGIVHATLLYYPLLNLLAAAAILSPEEGSPAAGTKD